MDRVAMLCAYVVQSWIVSPPDAEALRICHDIGAAALAEGHPVELVVALAYTESRLDASARSSRGALGPLQILPRYHCPARRARGCDLIEAGVRTISRFRARFGPSWSDVLCHWNSGNRCYRRSRHFARVVLRRAEELSLHGGSEVCGG